MEPVAILGRVYKVSQSIIIILYLCIILAS